MSGTGRPGLIVIALVLAACAAPDPPAKPPPGPSATGNRSGIPLGLDAYVPVPAGNPLTPAKVALGRRLFFDPLLSSDRSVACASCHRPEHAFADTVPRAVGVHGRGGPRNAPSLLNVAYGRVFSWDGRARTLEEQALLPVQNPLEMDLPLETMVARLLRARRDYRRAFRRAFGKAASADDVSAANVGRALASYLRTLRSGNAPIDRFRAGDTAALPGLARSGFDLFIGKAGCTACHLGPLFTDEGFHNTGVSWGSDDPGRYDVTGREADRGAFNTPSLRNVARTAPYMHDGSLATLEAVVDFYDRGGGPNPYLDEEIRPLGLTDEEKRALVVFLRSLTSSAAADTRKAAPAESGRDHSRQPLRKGESRRSP